MAAKPYGDALKEAGDYLKALEESIGRVRRDILGLHGQKDAMSSCRWHQLLEMLVAQLRHLTREHWMTEVRLRRLVAEPDNESIR